MTDEKTISNFSTRHLCAVCRKPFDFDELLDDETVGHHPVLGFVHLHHHGVRNWHATEEIKSNKGGITTSTPDTDTVRIKRERGGDE